MTKEITDGSSFIKKVLVAEDDHFVREYIHELFTLNGYEVKSASSIASSLRILDKEYFPVVVSELIFNNRKGLEILDYIRQQCLPSAVIYVTTYMSIDSLDRVLNLGAFDCINKPFISQILLHRVAQAVEYVRMKNIIASGVVYANKDERCRFCKDLKDVSGD